MEQKLSCKVSSKLVKTGAFCPTRILRSELEVALQMKSLSLELIGRGQRWVVIRGPTLRPGMNITAEVQNIRTVITKYHRCLQFTRPRFSSKLYVAPGVEAPSKTWPDLIPQLKPAQTAQVHVRVKQHLTTQFATRQVWFPAFAQSLKFCLWQILIQITCKILCTKSWVRLGGRLLFLARLIMRCQ